jgi:hypothetical protein
MGNRDPSLNSYGLYDAANPTRSYVGSNTTLAIQAGTSPAFGRRILCVRGGGRTVG